MNTYSKNYSVRKLFVNGRSSATLFALMASLASSPAAHAQEETDESIEERSGSYFCSIAEAEEAISGKRTFDAMEDYLRPPTRVQIPTAEREHLTDEGYALEGSYYWYIKAEPTEFGTYTIHGTFDFESKTLSTSRSMIGRLESGKVAAVATSFHFLCESVN